MEGNLWNPTSILRFEEALGTSTKPARVKTDAGSAIIKVINNPMGPQALARDFIGTSLASLFGLSVFDFAVLTVSEEDEIPINGDGIAAIGPAFCLRYTKGISWGGGEDELSDIENPQDIPLLVVFDNWVRNRDRHSPPEIPRRPHFDNVFFALNDGNAGRKRLMAIDHTECFTPTVELLNDRINRIDYIRDDSIYGLFPAFVNFITPDDLRQAVSQLNAIDKDAIKAIIEAVPREWGLTREGKVALNDLIVRRASFLSDNLYMKLHRCCWPGNLPGI